MNELGVDVSRLVLDDVCGTVVELVAITVDEVVVVAEEAVVIAVAEVGVDTMAVVWLEDTADGADVDDMVDTIAEVVLDAAKLVVVSLGGGADRAAMRLMMIFTS